MDGRATAHSFSAAENSSNSAWRQQLADAAGVTYKPAKQQPLADSKALVDTQDELSAEDMFIEDWIEEGDNKGIIEDTEVYNMDTGWSLTDLDLDDTQTPLGDVEVAP